MVRLDPITALAAALLATSVPAARAQELVGTGPHATPLFRLEAGLAVFELEHKGRERFVVVLLDERAEVIAKLADAKGSFSGSKAVRVPRDGRYLVDIGADGDWRIRLRDAPAGAPHPVSVVRDDTSLDPELAARARLAGEAAAGGWSWSWFVRGLVGGTIAGPLGAGVVVHRAGGSAVSSPEPHTAIETYGPPYVASYHAAYTDRLLARRRSAAVVGGLVGTAAFLFALLQVIDVSGDAGGSVAPPGSNPQLSVTFSLHR